MCKCSHFLSFTHKSLGFDTSCSAHFEFAILALNFQAFTSPKHYGCPPLILTRPVPIYLTVNPSQISSYPTTHLSIYSSMLEYARQQRLGKYHWGAQILFSNDDIVKAVVRAVKSDSFLLACYWAGWRACHVLRQWQQTKWGWIRLQTIKWNSIHFLQWFESISWIHKYRTRKSFNQRFLNDILFDKPLFEIYALTRWNRSFSSQGENL